VSSLQESDFVKFENQFLVPFLILFYPDSSSTLVLSAIFLVIIFLDDSIFDSFISVLLFFA
jgi:cell division protein FtsW (lipid II flippase)